ncbi:hypothetical protein V8E54_004719 [Elaphomyces granulatus]
MTVGSDSDSDSDDEECLFEDEMQHPPEYYLAEAENLDVSQLRQQKYSPKTRGHQTILATFPMEMLPGAC